MQQTETYKLNLIETTDTFSPDPLNENTRKLETALDAEAETRAAADAALDGRVTVLETHKVVAGTYTGLASGNDDWQFIDLGFTPKAVIITRIHISYAHLAVLGQPPHDYLAVREGGFTVSNNSSRSLNSRGSTYAFLALA